MNVDLHVHTVYSDGTDTEHELIENLILQNIEIFAVSDHDTVEGCRAVAPIVPDSLSFINSIEFSCRTEFKKCHILGLGIDIDHPSILAAVEAGKKLRAQKLESRLAHLNENHNIVFTDDEVAELHNINSVGKPHLANLIIKHGYAESVAEAIKNYLTFRGNNDRLDAKFAIDAIKAAGGVPVWAHPLGGEGEKRISEADFEIQLELLSKAGIEGLECYYSRYSGDEAAFLKTTADKHDLLISGGSDYHGSNKNISLGELSCDGSVVYANSLTVLQKL